MIQRTVNKNLANNNLHTPNVPSPAFGDGAVAVVAAAAVAGHWAQPGRDSGWHSSTIRCRSIPAADSALP